MHYYKFNIPDWCLGAGHLSLIEEAIYFRLINYYYDTENPIPIDYTPVLRKLRMAEYHDTAEVILDEFFVKTDRGYFHKRCEAILKGYRKTSKNNRENGAKGGRPRKYAACSETQEKPTGLFSETQTEPTHNPNYKLLTNNQEPITNNQLKDITQQAAKRPKAAKNFDVSNLDFSSWPQKPDEQILTDWVNLRKTKRAPITQTVINDFGRQLQAAVINGHTVNQCLSTAINRNWQGFSAEWMNPQKPINNQRQSSIALQFTAEDYNAGINSDGSF